MKKIFYLLSSMMLVFTACDPMEDVYEELDKAKKDETVVNTELTEDDYAFYEDDETVPHVATGQYFTGEAEAAALVPAILNEKYAHLDNGAVVTITYNTLMFPEVSNEVSEWEAYTVNAADYTANGERFPNFNSSSDVYRFLDRKYPNPEDRQLAVITYDYYSSGETSTITDSFYFINGDWENIYHVTAEDYALVKNRYGSFSASDMEMMPVYFDLHLKKDNIGAKEGDLRYVSYYFYDSDAETEAEERTQRVMAMYFNGTDWVPAVGATQKATLKFQKENNEWVPDLSVLYTLTQDDYLWIANNTELGTEASRANLKQFGNFSTYNWTMEDLYEAMGALLADKFPNAEAGEKFKVTFDSYPAGEMTLVLIKEESGEFVKFE